MPTTTNIQRTFTADVHTHILPGMDDGAQYTETSAAMIGMEVEQGVQKIVLSPHFVPEAESPSDFLKRRNFSAGQLEILVKNTPFFHHVDFRVAAEIRYSPFLPDVKELGNLCISGTKVLLIEFPFSHYPEFSMDVFYKIQLAGFIPLIAHVERYPWMRKKAEFLYDFVSCGAFAQVNADSLVTDKKAFNFFADMYEKNLVHCIASDTHNTEERPPKMREAAELIAEKLGDEAVLKINNVSEALLSGRIPEKDIPYKPKAAKTIFSFLKK